MKQPPSQFKMMQANYQGEGEPNYIDEAAASATSKFHPMGERAEPLYIANRGYEEYR